MSAWLIPFREPVSSMSDTPHRPASAGDYPAVGVIAGAREAGFRVPDDFSVVGYGGYLDPAVMPEYRDIVRPRRALMLALGLVMGSLFGMMVAFGREYQSSRR